MDYLVIQIEIGIAIEIESNDCSNMLDSDFDSDFDFEKDILQTIKSIEEAAMIETILKPLSINIRP